MLRRAGKIGFSPVKKPLHTPMQPTSGETPASPEEYAECIQATWQEATESIMVVARLCAQANKQLGPDEKKRLLKLLPFSLPVFSKLAQIGGDDRLFQQDVQRLLPPNYSIIYSIGQLDDKELKAAIQEGVIAPDLKRTELAEWVKNNNPSSVNPNKLLTISEEFFAASRLPENISTQQIEQLNSILEKISSQFGAQIIRPRNTYGQRMQRWQDQVMKRMRRSARQIVRESKRRCNQKGRKWGFHWDEVHIDEFADRDRIWEVLDTVGRSDEFLPLEHEAYAAIDPPTPTKYFAGIQVDDQNQFKEVADQLAKKKETRCRPSAWHSKGLIQRESGSR
jgi:hypothetical protein